MDKFVIQSLIFILIISYYNTVFGGEGEDGRLYLLIHVPAITALQQKTLRINRMKFMQNFGMLKCVNLINSQQRPVYKFKKFSGHAENAKINIYVCLFQLILRRDMRDRILGLRLFLG